MTRRQFLALAGAAAAWPLAARGQQGAMPRIGYLSSQSAATVPGFLAAFHRGLAEIGFGEGRNVSVEYRWADARFDRLPTLAAEIVRAQPAVIVAAGGNLATLAAKAATSTIPIVFAGADDPVRLGLVASFNRPAGNITGTALFNAGLVAKRLGLLRELAPQTTRVRLLVNPSNPTTPNQIAEIRQAAGPQTIEIVNVTSDDHFVDGFAGLARDNTDAVIVGADPLFLVRRERLVTLAMQHAVPVMYFQREFATAGGLIAYGVNFAENYRQAGLYTGRILKGEKPGDLPVVQPSKFELVINLRTAKALGLAIPHNLLVTADEVIE